MSVPRIATPVGRKQIAAASIDLMLLPFMVAVAPVAALLGRLRHKAPLSRAVLDRFNVAVVRHHYYEPILFPVDLRGDLDAQRALPGLDLNEAGQLDLVSRFDYAQELQEIPLRAAAPLQFGYENPSFGPGDAEFLYNMIRHFKPRRLYEIGSGQSTLLARRALTRNERDGHDCEHVCIEPYEQPWLEQLGVRIVREKVEVVDPGLFRQLEAGDILFIDSSHVIRPQGDVVHEYLLLLGQLQPGVIVHVHDIFTPRDYLRNWVVTERRMWNEQYLLEAFLSFNGDYEVMAAVNWLWHTHPGRLARAAPILGEHPLAEPGSFWFRRRPSSPYKA
jgi:hypothetical protein